jgi:hypothetical protein
MIFIIYCSLNYFLNFLKGRNWAHMLFTFQSRIYNKVLLFAHGIKTNSRPPLELKSYLEMEVSDEEQPTEQPETKPPGIVPSDVENTQTNLRKVLPIQVNLFQRENIKIFLNKFPKFDIKYSVAPRFSQLANARIEIQLRRAC